MADATVLSMPVVCLPNLIWVNILHYIRQAYTKAVPNNTDPSLRAPRAILIQSVPRQRQATEFETALAVAGR